MFEWMFTIDGWIGLATLTLLEIVLGIDNLVFLTIAASKLPREQREKAQKIGLIGALVLRILMLSMLVWLTKLVTPITTFGDFTLTWRDVILLLGGLFLLWKGTAEIHQEVEGGSEGPQEARATSFMGVIGVIMVLDFIFALDSIVTAVGLTDILPIMILANVFAIIIMIVSARTIGDFIDRHPTIKMLALSFILLVGVALVADGMHFHIPREYIYFAIAFSLGVEALNMLVRNRRVGAVADKSEGDE
ncbi:MAG: TerC family protein [Rhizobiales bacterium]|nr:TerC family protein [Hyphomicrobiales bacterium]